MSVEFDSPANRIISEFAPKNKFAIQLLPDIAFLRQLSIQGRMRYFSGSNGGGGNMITITPPTGETFFFYSAFAVNVTGAGIVSLINDGQTRQAITIGGAGETLANFNIGIDSLVGDGSKTFRMENSANTASGNIIGWVENTSRIRDVTT